MLSKILSKNNNFYSLKIQNGEKDKNIKVFEILTEFGVTHFTLHLKKIYAKKSGPQMDPKIQGEVKDLRKIVEK